MALAGGDALSGGAMKVPAYAGPGGDPSGGSTPPPPPPTGPSAGGPPPPPPADTPPPSITTNPGYTPDTKSLIENDPGYAAWKQAADAQEAQSAAQRQAALRQAVIQYGGMPAGFVDQYGDIDQATLDAAAKNQYSTIAGIKQSYAQSQRQFLAQLAARGALQSGDLNYGQDQLDRGYGQNLYDAGNAFGGSAVGAENAYTGTLQQIAQGRVGAVQAAEGAVASNPAYAPRQPQTAAYNAAASAKYGHPVYTSTDDAGNTTFYALDGTVLGSEGQGSTSIEDWLTGQRKGNESTGV